MVHAKIKTRQFQQAMNAVTVLVEEAKLVFGVDGLHVQTVDAANVGAVRLFLSENAFDEYDAAEEEVCLDLQRIRKILSQIEGEALLEISVDSQHREFHIKSNGYKFDLPLLAEETVRVGHDVDSLDPSASMELTGEQLSRTAQIGNMFAEQMAIGTDPGRDLVYMTAEGDNDGMHATFERDDLVSLDMGESHSYYSLNYLQKLSKVIPDKQDVQIGIGEEFPAKIQFEIAGGEGKVNYSLAPRVQ